MAIDHDYIREVLARFEGNGVARGYVPCRGGEPLGVSGVTVGTGCDLGQQSAAGLLDMGVPHALVKKLLPYIGLKKQAAVEAVKRQPLTLTGAEVKTLDDAVIGRYLKNISQCYDSGNPSRTFAHIPSPAQAVLVSILYQRGLGFRTKNPGWWGPMLAGDWKAAAAWLRDPANGGGYHTRRKSEGELLGLIKPEDRAAGATRAVGAAEAAASHRKK